MITADLEAAITTLRGDAVDIAAARRAPGDGGIPLEPGLYSWWARPAALRGIKGPAHPSIADLELLYVGIAPKDDHSIQTLRTRVIGNHVSGNTGSSTFRLTLASLLRDDLGFHPQRKGNKFVLPSAENRELSTWQQQNLRLCWCVLPEPWSVEARVIAEMTPPLNLAENTSHPLFMTVKAARAGFRESAVER